MADGLNKVMLIGNLGQDPELRFTQSKQPVMSMRIATSETFNNRDGVRQERTEWHSIVLWGKRAEALAKFLTKGTKIYVEGRLQTRTWDDKQGNKRYATEINAQEIILLGGGGGRGGAPRTSQDAPGGGHDEEHGGGGRGDEGGGGGGGRGDEGGGGDFGDDDIPF
jgi:single-strand DNA-binding protein